MCCCLWVLTNVHWYILLQYHTEWFHYPKNPLYSPSLLTGKPLAAAYLVTISIVLPFLKCHWNHTYVAISDWLLSLSNMHVSFFHVFSWFDSLFLFRAECNSPLYGCTIVCPFTYWRISWLLPSFLFYFFAIMNKVALNICVLVFVWMEGFDSFG